MTAPNKTSRHIIMTTSITLLAASTLAGGGCALIDSALPAKETTQEDMTSMVMDMGPAEDMAPPLPACTSNADCERDQTCIRLARNKEAPQAVCAELFSIGSAVNYAAPSSDTYATLEVDEEDLTLHMVNFSEDSKETFEVTAIDLSTNASLETTTYTLPGGADLEDLKISSFEVSTRSENIYLSLTEEPKSGATTTNSYVLNPEDETITPLDSEIKVGDASGPAILASELKLLDESTTASTLYIRNNEEDVVATAGYFCRTDEGMCTNAVINRKEESALLKTERNFMDPRRALHTFAIRADQDHAATFYSEPSQPKLLGVFARAHDGEDKFVRRQSIGDSEGVNNECGDQVLFFEEPQKHSALVLASQLSANNNGNVLFLALTASSATSETPSGLLMGTYTPNSIRAVCRPLGEYKEVQLLDAAVRPDFSSFQGPSFRAALATSLSNGSDPDTLLLYDVDQPLEAGDNITNMTNGAIVNKSQTLQIYSSIDSQNPLSILDAFRVNDESSEFIVLATSSSFEETQKELFAFRVSISGQLLPL